MMHIVLHEPLIPQNTGNIVRTCKSTGSVLHLIEPLGFVIEDKKLKRAGTDGDYLIFGKETAGLPVPILEQYPDRCLRVPMVKDNRSLNVSNAVAIVLFEALRQNGYSNLV